MNKLIQEALNILGEDINLNLTHVTTDKTEKPQEPLFEIKEYAVFLNVDGNTAKYFVLPKSAMKGKNLTVADLEKSKLFTKTWKLTTKEEDVKARRDEQDKYGRYVITAFINAKTKFFQDKITSLKADQASVDRVLGTGSKAVPQSKPDEVHSNPGTKDIKIDTQDLKPQLIKAGGKK